MLKMLMALFNRPKEGEDDYLFRVGFYASMDVLLFPYSPRIVDLKDIDLLHPAFVSGTQAGSEVAERISASRLGQNMQVEHAALAFPEPQN